jgi:hypothetical protein
LIERSATRAIRGPFLVKTISLVTPAGRTVRWKSLSPLAHLQRRRSRRRSGRMVAAVRRRVLQ